MSYGFLLNTSRWSYLTWVEISGEAGTFCIIAVEEGI